MQAKEVPESSAKAAKRPSNKMTVMTTASNQTTVSPPLILQDTLMHGGIYGVRKCYSMLVETGKKSFCYALLQVLLFNRRLFGKLQNEQHCVRHCRANVDGALRRIAPAGLLRA